MCVVRDVGYARKKTVGDSRAGGQKEHHRNVHVVKGKTSMAGVIVEDEKNRVR